MNAEIEAAYSNVFKAERALEALIKKIYHVGYVVYYSHGDHAVAAKVVGQAGDRLRVRGLKSGKEHWITASRVIS